jgi:predicted NBD/HSP70 family sugar kinase
MKIHIGLDIGGTKLLVCASTRDGEILRRTSRATPLPVQEGLDALHDMVAEVAGGDEIVAFGAAAGGPLDWERGVVSPLHQPEWRDVPLKDIFKGRWGAPLAVDVDTNAAVLAEYEFGSAHVSRLIYLTLSTGMGGGFLVDGELYRGQKGSHPEMGHHAIPYRCMYPERIECECGADRCLESLVSGNGIRRIYGKPAQDLNGDEWAEVSYNLGQGLRNLAALYSPDLIVLGGGVAVGGGDRLLAAAISIMRDNCKLVPVPEVRLSTLGYDTALYGALALAKRAAG